MVSRPRVRTPSRRRHSVESWEETWPEFSTFYQYGRRCGGFIYTTNAVESLHRQLRKASELSASKCSKRAIHRRQPLRNLAYSVFVAPLIDGEHVRKGDQHVRMAIAPEPIWLHHTPAACSGKARCVKVWSSRRIRSTLK
jgi:hypothetical protein